MWSRQTLALIDAACDEDLGDGDLTAALLPAPDRQVESRVVPRRTGVICGLALGPAICDAFAKRLWQTLVFSPAAHAGRVFRDADQVAAGDTVATLRGAHGAVLTVERTLLNFLARMSGVATLTQRYVAAARQVSPAVEIVDTRKTIPGWRELDKYAVRAGGGRNHRAGLYDAVLIKDNHLAAIPTDRLAGGLSQMVHKAAAAGPKFIQVEVDDLAQLTEVCKVAGVNMVLLDNFSLPDLRAAVALRDQRGLRGKLLLEASGGVTLENIAEIAAAGVDRISVGAITHSAPALDIGLDL